MDESSDVDTATQRPGRRVRAARRWRELIEAHAASGLGVGAYCRQQGITGSCFYRWRRILAAGGGTSPGVRQATSTDSASSSQADSTCSWQAGSGAARRCRPAAPQAFSGGGVFARVRVGDELWAGQVMSLRLRAGRELLLPLSMPVDRLVELVVAIEKTGGPS